MDEDEADANFDPNLSLLRGTSSDVNTMSDDFLSMLNTDCKPSDIDEFNTWFQDNITPDTTHHISDSILDNLAADSAFEVLPNTLHDGSNVSTQFYPCYDDVQSDTQHFSGYNELVDDSVPPLYNIDAMSSTNEQVHANPGSYSSMYNKNDYTDNARTGRACSQVLSNPRNEETSNDVGEKEEDDYFIKETYFQDESGNTFIEQQYIRKKEKNYSNGCTQSQMQNSHEIGSKRPRVAQLVQPQNKIINKEFVPQKTIIRSVRSHPSNINQKMNQTFMKQMKTSQPIVQRSSNPVKNEMKVGPNVRQSNPNYISHRSPNMTVPKRGPGSMEQKSRVFVADKRQIFHASSPAGVSPPRVLYFSQEDQDDTPSNVTYYKPPMSRDMNMATQQSTEESTLHPIQQSSQKEMPRPKESLSPTSGVISAWEQSIKQKSPGVPSNISFAPGRMPIHNGQRGVKASSVIIKTHPGHMPHGNRPHNSAQQKTRPSNPNRIEITKVPVIKQEQPKTEDKIKDNCKMFNGKDVNHISIVGKPGLVNMKAGAPTSPSNIKIVKPINSTKPIIKQTKISVKKETTVIPELVPEEEPEEKRTNHNAVERKYRYSINDKILELKQMLVPKDAKIQKSGILRKAIEHINNLQSMINKLKYDNTQLKKKQDILEQNNHVLTLKLAEQGASVVYLEKTPDLIEPTGPYGDIDFVNKSTSVLQNSPEQSPPYYQNIYQNLPDSPESMRQSDGECARHVRSNSASSGGYSSSEDMNSHLVKKPRHNITTNHRDQRTMPMLCMVFMFGLFLPYLLPQQSIASTTFGRTLLSVSKSHDYISPLMSLAMYVLGFIVITTLSYLFFVIKSKVLIKDENLFKEHLQNIKSAIKNGEEISAQTDLEQMLCNIGVRVYHTKLSYYLLIVEYMLSILPHNKIVHWLCCNNSSVLSDMLLQLTHMQYSLKFKRYESWVGLCYALQAARYNLSATNIYITLCLIVNNKIAKAHFYRRSNRRDDRWINRATDFIWSWRMMDVPLGDNVSSCLELAYTRQMVNRAARILVLSGDGTVVRRQAANQLLKEAAPSLLFLKKEYPATCKELNWLVALLEAYQASDDDIKSLKFNNASECTRALSTTYNAMQQAEGVTGEEVSDMIDMFHEQIDRDNTYKMLLCVGVECLFKLQIDVWRAEDTHTVTHTQKSNFKRTIQLLEAFGGYEAQYKVSLYTTIHRVMCRANPTLTKKHLQNILHPAVETVNNHEQVLAIDVCLKYVPSLLLPSKDKFIEHMNVFLRSQD